MMPLTRKAAPESVTVISPRTSVGFRQHPREPPQGTHTTTATDRTQAGTTTGGGADACRPALHRYPPKDDRSTTRETPHHQGTAKRKPPHSR
jgi:hypothetical protein